MRDSPFPRRRSLPTPELGLTSLELSGKGHIHNEWTFFTSLNRYIAAKKIPLPPLVRVGGVRVRLWSDKDIAKVRAVLPKLKNGRKTRYKKKAREK
jgi:hypothetical protein